MDRPLKLTFLIGCVLGLIAAGITITIENRPKTEIIESPRITVEAYVAATEYRPEHMETNLVPSAGKGSMIGMDGGVGIPVGDNLVLSNRMVPAYYSTTLIIKNKPYTTNSPEIYRRATASIGGFILIQYIERRKVTYNNLGHIEKEVLKGIRILDDLKM